MSWKKLIPGCFAGMNAPFGVHPKDAERVSMMAATMRAEGVSWQEAEIEIRAYLQSQRVTADEKMKQMHRVQEKLKPQLA